MKHSLGVAAQVCYFGTGWVFPQAELVLAEPVGTQDLLVLLVPDQRTDLALSVDSINQFACLNVPKPHGLIGSSASCR